MTATFGAHEAAEALGHISRNMVGSAGIFIACLVGLVLAAATWRRHPRVSLLLVVAFAVLLLVPVVNAVLAAAVFPAMYRNVPTGAMRVVIPLAYGVGSLFTAGAYGLLAWAALTGRKKTDG